MAHRRIKTRWLVLAVLASAALVALSGLAIYTLYETMLARRAQSSYKLSRPGYPDDPERFLTLGIALGDTAEQVRAKLPKPAYRSLTYPSQGPQGRTRTTVEHWLNHSARGSILGFEAKATFVEIYAVTFDESGQVIELKRTLLKDMGIQQEQQLLPDQPLP